MRKDKEKEMDERYSYSKLDTYQQCPFKFKLKYIDGHNAFHSSVHTEVGTAIHSCEEAIAKKLKFGEKPDYVALKNGLVLKMAEIERKYPRDYRAKDKSGRTFAEKIGDYLETGIYRLEQFMKDHPKYEIAGIEQPFQFIFKTGQTIRGFIDRVFKDNEHNLYIVQDIKTWPQEAEQEKLSTPLQFVIYALAVKEIYGCDFAQIRCQYYLPFCDVAQSAGTYGYINRGTAKMEKLFERIGGKDYAPSTSPLCNYCEFCMTNPDAVTDDRYLCPYFSLWERETRNRHDISRTENDWQGLENHGRVWECFVRSIGKAELLEKFGKEEKKDE